MNMLEVCKRLAEIEGYTVDVNDYVCKVIKTKGTNFIEEFNPLTDPVVLQALVIKHHVHMGQNEFDYWVAECITEWDDSHAVWNNPSVQKDYEWAACLAIIEEHKP